MYVVIPNPAIRCIDNVIQRLNLSVLHANTAPSGVPGVSGWALPANLITMDQDPGSRATAIGGGAAQQDPGGAIVAVADRVALATDRRVLSAATGESRCIPVVAAVFVASVACCRSGPRLTSGRSPPTP